jgi:hypothetical protein
LQTTTIVQRGFQLVKIKERQNEQWRLWLEPALVVFGGFEGLAGLNADERQLLFQRWFLFRRCSGKRG